MPPYTVGEGIGGSIGAIADVRWRMMSCAHAAAASPAMPGSELVAHNGEKWCKDATCFAVIDE